MPKLKAPSPPTTDSTPSSDNKKNGKTPSKKKGGQAAVAEPSKQEATSSNGQPPTKANGKPRKGKQQAPEQEVVYPKLGVKVFCVNPNLLPEGLEPEALTAEIAKQYLGWREESENIKFGDYYQLVYTNLEGQNRKVRCVNNTSNRPFDQRLAEDWMLEILRRKWRLNGETFIIDRHGLTQDCQHRFIGLVLAVNEWHIDQKRDAPSRKWQGYWKEEPYLEGIVVTGIYGDDDTVNTIGTGKKRSLADALYRHSWFNTLPIKEREQAAKTTESATKLLWRRTAQELNSDAPRRPHSESFEFIEHHKRILDCVRFIRDESAGKQAPEGLSFISKGQASCLLYLMGSAASDSDEYDKALNESALNWDLWDLAQEFWVDFMNNGKTTESLREALLNIPADASGAYANDLKVGMIIKAFNLYSDGKKVTEDGVAMESTRNELGQPVLAEVPRLGGIDVGKVKVEE